MQSPSEAADTVLEQLMRLPSDARAAAVVQMHPDTLTGIARQMPGLRSETAEQLARRTFMGLGVKLDRALEVGLIRVAP